MSNTLGCAPASAPTDTAFYLSGAAAEGVAAFPALVAPAGLSYAASPFGAAAGALVLSNGTYLAAPGSALPASLPHGFSAGWSAAAWVKCAPPSSWSSVLRWGGTTPGAYIGLEVDSPAPNEYSGVANLIPACDSAWHSVALVYSASAMPYPLSVFLDGVLAYASVTSILLPSTPASSLRVGWSGDLGTNNGSLFSGALSDLRIYSRPLSSSEVVALSQPPLPAAPNTFRTPRLQAAGVSNYTWVCAAGFSGTPASLARNSTDGSWMWADGVQPTCSACAPGSYSFAGAACSPCPAGSTFVSSALGCAPSATLTAGPADTAFYLSGSSAEGVAALMTTPAPLPTARYVRLATPPGFSGFLNIADVEVLAADGTTNFALRSASLGANIPPVASSASCGARLATTAPNAALDGNHASYFQAQAASCLWWQVDLGVAQPIWGVRVWPLAGAAAAPGNVNGSTLSLSNAADGGSTPPLWTWLLPAAINASGSALFFSSSTALGFVPDAFNTAGGALALAGGTFVSATAPQLPLPSGNAPFTAAAWVRCMPWPGTLTALSWGAAGAPASPGGANTAALKLGAAPGSSFALTTVQVSTLALTSASGGAILSGSLAGLAVSSADRVLYLADLGARRIARVNLTTLSVAATWCGSGSEVMGDGLCAAAGFAAPFALALDTVRGTLYVGDAGGALRALALATATVTTVAAIPVTQQTPLGLAVNPLTGAVLVTDAVRGFSQHLCR